MVLPLFMHIAPLVLQLFGSSGPPASGGVSRRGHFYWEFDTLTPVLRAAPAAVHTALRATTDLYSLQSEGFAKNNAPWTDRTGNARGSLTGTPKVSDGTYEVVISHGMPYGIWLELRGRGRFGVIDKTVQAQADPYFRTAAKAVAAVLGAR